jgi:hypothetical protein
VLWAGDAPGGGLGARVATRCSIGETPRSNGMIKRLQRVSTYRTLWVIGSFPPWP